MQELSAAQGSSAACWISGSTACAAHSDDANASVRKRCMAAVVLGHWWSFMSMSSSLPAEFLCSKAL